ncbi:MAG: diguanylate cyclase domain-containing protein [Vampirovibrionales bacterium]
MMATHSKKELSQSSPLPDTSVTQEVAVHSGTKRIVTSKHLKKHKDSEVSVSSAVQATAQERRKEKRQKQDTLPPVYILMDSVIPNFDLWEEDLQAVPKVTPVFSQRELKTLLAQNETGVVCFAPTSPKTVSEQVLEFQRLNPNVQTIAIICPEYQLAYSKFFPQPGCDLLTVPTDALTIQTRIFQARQVSMLRAECVKQQVVDEVPELHNRRFFFSQLQERLNLSKQSQKPVTCLVLSLDFYPLYFDTYGLDVTINMLRFIAKNLRQLTRKHDILARLSDNQIGILMSNSDDLGAAHVVRRIQKYLANHPYLLQHSHYGKPIEESLSIHGGSACYNPNDLEHTLIATGDDLVRYASHALFQAIQETVASGCDSPRELPLVSFDPAQLNLDI